MRSFNPIAFMAALLAVMAFLPVSAKNIQVPKAYMFGFSASFNDSTVYFTDIQEVDSVWVDQKKGFLAERSQYSYQLRDHFTTSTGQSHRTCVVVSSLKRQDVEKKYAKMKKQYVEKNAGKYDVRYLTAADFQFKPVRLADESQESTQPTSKKEKRENKPKKGAGQPPHDKPAPPHQ